MPTETTTGPGMSPMTAECSLCSGATRRGAVLDRRESKEEPRGIFWICGDCVKKHHEVESEIAFALREKSASAEPA